MAICHIILVGNFLVSELNMSNLLRHFGLPDMGVDYQKFQAGSPDGYLDFGVISTPVAGTARGMVDTYLVEFMWRLKFEEDPFENTMKGIRRVYPV